MREIVPGGRKPTAPRVTRYIELDGLRGVAALVVVFHHALLAYTPAWELFESRPGAPAAGLLWAMYKTPLYILISGPAAVSVFFVLSGAVLFYAFVEVDRLSLVSYIPKRLARIWIPFFFALTASALLYIFVHPASEPSLSGWFNIPSWDHRLSLAQYLKQALMLGPETWLDNPMWSLVHELRISLIFPLIIFFLKRSRLATLIVTALLSIVIVVFIRYFHNPYAVSLASTLEYLFAFSTGGALMLSRGRIASIFRSLPPTTLAAIAATALLMLLANSPADPGLRFISHPLRELPVTLGAGLLVSLAIGGGLPILANRVAQWLGNVSYSLYLVHVPMILTLLHVSHGKHLFSLLLLAVFLSLAAAWAMQRTVEDASKRIGRSIARRLQPRRVLPVL